MSVKTTTAPRPAARAAQETKAAKPSPPAAAAARLDDVTLQNLRCPACGSIDEDHFLYFGADWHRASDMSLDASVERVQPSPHDHMTCEAPSGRGGECGHSGTIQDFIDAWSRVQPTGAYKSEWSSPRRAEEPPASADADAGDDAGDEENGPEDDEVGPGGGGTGAVLEEPDYEAGDADALFEAYGFSDADDEDADVDAD